MPTPSGKPTAAGFRNLFLGFTDDDGVLIGASPTRPAQGTGSGMLHIWAVKRAAPTIPNPDVVIDEGDDGEILTEFNFRSIASRAFVIEVAADDFTAAGVLQNVPVRSIGRGQFVAADVNNVPSYNVCLILQSRAIDSYSGAQQWAGVIIPRAVANYLGRAEFNDRTPAVFRFYVTPQPAGWSPLGYTYLDNDSNPKSPFYDPFKGYTNPLTMQAFTGNGILAAIPVDYAPISVAASVLSTVPASGQGATNAAIASVTTATPFAITASVAPVAATRNTLLYEFSS